MRVGSGGVALTSPREKCSQNRGRTIAATQPSSSLNDPRYTSPLEFDFETAWRFTLLASSATVQPAGSASSKAVALWASAEAGGAAGGATL